MMTKTEIYENALENLTLIVRLQYDQLREYAYRKDAPPELRKAVRDNEKKIDWLKNEIDNLRRAV